MESFGSEFDSPRVQELIGLCEKYKGLYIKGRDVDVHYGLWDREFNGYNSSDVEWDLIETISEDEAIILYLSTPFAYDTLSHHIHHLIMQRNFLAKFKDEELREELDRRVLERNKQDLERSINELKRIKEDKDKLILRELELETRIDMLKSPACGGDKMPL